MTQRGRLFMDVSYTRTQHVSVGITRTVRRLEEELRHVHGEQGGTFTPVSFHSKGFRVTGLVAAPQFRKADGDKPAGRLFRWITGAFFRKVVLAALFLPWPVLRLIWSATSKWTFNFLSRSEPGVAFAPGDILFLCDASWNYPVWIAARRARAQGASVVLLMYDLIPLRHPQFCFPLVPFIFRLWLDRMLATADAVVCISDATEQDLRRHARETGATLPTTGNFRLGSDPVRAASGGPVRSVLEQFMTGAAPSFAAIGSFEPKKNYGFLLDVFERLWDRGVDARLLIIGRETAECHDLIQRFRLHPEQGIRLLTLFDADDTEVGFAYANCRALVFPSSAEGFGLPLVEARTRGSLVIASSLPAFVELADAGVSIYPEGSHTALESLIVEHSRTDKRRHVAPMDPFTWQDSARQCMRLVDRLLKRNETP